MNIVIRISHPAHVYKFLHLIRLLKKNNSIFIVAIDKEMTIYLLNKFGIEYYLVGRNKKGILKKLISLIIQEFKLYFKLRRFEPDIFIGGGDPLLAHVSFLYKKPYIAFEDTESAKLILKSYKNIAANILTPDSYFNNLGDKHIRYRGNHELAYLHSEFFKPDPQVIHYLNLVQSEKYAIIRFVSWDASHDIGITGLSYDQKVKLVKELSKYLKIFISSECELGGEINAYKINIPQEMMHSALFYACLYIGEGATMASECALLGTPAIYINPLNAGIIKEEVDAGILFHHTLYNEISDAAIKIILDPVSKVSSKLGALNFLNTKINVTAFWYWFIEKYPESSLKMKTNPDYQLKFK